MSKRNVETLGQWVKRWREEEGLTQAELAQLVGKTKSYISNIERGQPHAETGTLPQPRIQVVDRLAKALKRPIAEARALAGYGEAIPVVSRSNITIDRLVDYASALSEPRQKELLAIAKLFSQYDQAEIEKALMQAMSEGKTTDPSEITSSDVRPVARRPRGKG